MPVLTYSREGTGLTTADDVFNSDVVYLGGVTHDSGALRFLSNVSEAPRIPVRPTISGTPTSQYEILATAGEVLGVKATANALDDTAANERLLNSGPGVALCHRGNEIILVADSAITRVDTVGVGSVDVASTGGTVNTDTGATAANVAAARIQWDFLEADNVRTVRISMSHGHTDSVATAHTPTKALMIVEGYTHD